MSTGAKPTTLTVWTDPKSGRRYVDSEDIAKICGVAYLDLHNKLLPESWAMPRDFWWDGRRTWFAVLSLQQLADWLIKLGENDASLRLREWSTAWIEAAIAEEVLRGGASPREKLTAGSGGGSERAEIVKGGDAGSPAAAPAQDSGVKRMWYQQDAGGMG